MISVMPIYLLVIEMLNLCTMNMTNKYIRKDNLRALIIEFKSAAAVARMADTSASYISQVLSDKTNREVGDDLARKLEAGCNKSIGWMDLSHQDVFDEHGGVISSGWDAESLELYVTSGAIEENAFEAPELGVFSIIPVVGTAQLGDNGHWSELGYPAGHGDSEIDFPTRDKNTYALRCVGTSMMPRIRDGEFVIIEPNTEVQPGDDVMVMSKSGKVMVKTFLYKRDDRVHFF